MPRRLTEREKEILNDSFNVGYEAGYSDAKSGRGFSSLKRQGKRKHKKR